VAPPLDVGYQQADNWYWRSGDGRNATPIITSDSGSLPYTSRLDYLAAEYANARIQLKYAFAMVCARNLHFLTLCPPHLQREPLTAARKIVGILHQAGGVRDQAAVFHTKQGRIDTEQPTQGGTPCSQR